MRYTVLLTVILGAGMIGSLIIVKILTRNLSTIRKNFYRSLSYFVVFPLFIFFTTVRDIVPPKPLDLPANIPASIEVQQQLTAMKYYTDSVEIYLDYQNDIFYLLVALMFGFSLLPTFSLAYYYMKRLEALGEDDERIL